MIIPILTRIRRALKSTINDSTSPFAIREAAILADRHLGRYNEQLYKADVYWVATGTYLLLISTSFFPHHSTLFSSHGSIT